jgi:hypothetical protein
MTVKFISSYGWCEALLGIGLSYGISSGIDLGGLHADSDLKDKLVEIAKSLAYKDNGENKFMRQISVWLDITAPLYWWKQMDQYKVGTTTQSESTMHTLMKSSLSIDNFEKPYNPAQEVNEDTEKWALDMGTLIGTLNSYISEYKTDVRLDRKQFLFNAVVAMLPESFLQRRIVSCNVSVLRNIVAQRYKHKLPQWKIFCDAVKAIPVYETLFGDRTAGESTPAASVPVATLKPAKPTTQPEPLVTPRPWQPTPPWPEVPPSIPPAGMPMYAPWAVTPHPIKPPKALA